MPTRGYEVVYVDSGMLRGVVEKGEVFRSMSEIKRRVERARPNSQGYRWSWGRWLSDPQCMSVKAHGRPVRRLLQHCHWYMGVRLEIAPVVETEENRRSK